MDLFAHYHRRAVACLDRQIRDGLLPPGLDREGFTAAPPASGSAWDIVIDAALVHGPSAVAAGRDPRDPAQAIARDLEGDPRSAAVAVAGPGFVNVTLRPDAVLEAVASVLRCGVGLGCARAEAGRVPADLRSAPSLDAARAIVTAEQRASLSALAEPVDPIVGQGPQTLGAVSTRRQAVGAERACEALAGLAADSFRFAVASSRPEATLHLDLALLADRSRRNPGFWIPYAHARMVGLSRRAAAILPDIDLRPAALAEADLSVLTDPGEIALARIVARQAHVVSAAAALSRPGRVAADLGDLASRVHSQWNSGKDQPQLRFVNQEERALTKARLGLAMASALVLTFGLGILGVTAPEEML